ncbi:uncharacterized protein LOC132624260 [Lycium barbarum]|uniref:uncharacterized protein LOC132624260 n=1 Tax=Lycium barbarum TaxID=112863 RepID=UPI00293ED36B|nr:uncharacterized protein LOC132624260 [Lycium barbarum]
MVADMGDRVHRFVIGLGPHLIKEGLTALLQEGMDVYRIQAHVQNLEEQQLSQKGEHDYDRGYSKRARSFGKRFDCPIYSGPVHSFRVSNSQYTGDPSQMRPPLPRCNQCGKLHLGHCRLGSSACYAYGQTGHMLRDCLLRGGKGRAQPTGSAASSSSPVCPLGQGSQAPAGHGRGREGASSSNGPQNCIYTLAG